MEISLIIIKAHHVQNHHVFFLFPIKVHSNLTNGKNKIRVTTNLTSKSIAFALGILILIQVMLALQFEWNYSLLQMGSTTKFHLISNFQQRNSTKFEIKSNVKVEKNTRKGV